MPPTGVEGDESLMLWSKFTWFLVRTQITDLSPTNYVPYTGALRYWMWRGDSKKSNWKVTLFSGHVFKVPTYLKFYFISLSCWAFRSKGSSEPPSKLFEIVHVENFL
jgi:hypothetical protein